jgi:lipoprotein NlpI
VTEPDFQAAAASKIAKTDSNQHCEAWFYIGMKHLLAGDKADARESFNKCIATGQSTFVEYAFAQAELKALDK